jgi:hypothetical protein
VKRGSNGQRSNLEEISSEAGLYAGTLIKGVIPKPRVLSSGARDLPYSD